MKILVLYTSHAGSTKKYAEDIASRTGADIVPLKKLKVKGLTHYDTIIFGGWVDNGQIKGLNEFLSNWTLMENKNVIVFSSGIVIPSREGRETIIETNLLNLYHLRYYQLRGSFNINRLHFPYSFIVKTIAKRVEGQANPNPEQMSFVTLKNNPVEYYDTEGIDKICNVIRSLNVIDVEVKEK